MHKLYTIYKLLIGLNTKLRLCKHIAYDMILFLYDMCNCIYIIFRKLFFWALYIKLTITQSSLYTSAKFSFSTNKVKFFFYCSIVVLSRRLLATNFPCKVCSLTPHSASYNAFIKFMLKYIINIYMFHPAFHIYLIKYLHKYYRVD